MDNVIVLRPVATARKTPTTAEGAKALAEALSLLGGTIDAVRNNDGETDICHLTCIEKIRDLLSLLCDVDGDLNHKALQALSLVELARLAASPAGSEFFDVVRRTSQGWAVAEALEAALDRLDSAGLAHG